MPRDRKKVPVRDVIRLEKYLPYRIARLDDRLLVKNSGLHEGRYKLTTQEWKVLSIIADYGPVTPAEIRRQSTQDKSTVSWAIKRLDRRKFLKTAKEPEDARTFRVSLSGAGWRYYGAIVPKSRKLERDVLKALTKAEAAQFRRLLEKLTAD
jgi:DNA-binding MarR family transcriptional regulator